MSTFTKEQRQTIIAVFQPILREECALAEWDIDHIAADSYLAAQRTVVSIGKTDQADIHAPAGDEYNGVLRSQYVSQGNNILSTTTTFFDWDLTEEAFRAVARDYIQQVDFQINACKMVRLAHKD